MKNILFTLTAMILSSNMVYAETSAPKSKEEIREEIKAQVAQIKAACAADIATTGCTSEGREQMRCIKEYKKAHKEFKFSDACKDARKGIRKERKAMRKERKAGKDEKSETK